MANLVWYPVSGDGQSPSTAYTWATGNFLWDSVSGWASADLLNLVAPPAAAGTVPGSGDNVYAIAGEINPTYVNEYNTFEANGSTDPYIGSNNFGVFLTVTADVTIASLTLASFNQYADAPTYPAVDVSGSSLDITGNLMGTAEAIIPSFGTVTTDGNGILDIAAGGTAAIGGIVQAEVNIDFLDAQNNLLVLQNPDPSNAGNYTGPFSGLISGFVAGDTIDLSAVAYTGGQPGTIASDGQLTLVENSQTYYLGFATAEAGTTVEAARDLSGTGTDLTVNCFTAGTRILTAHGEVAVENLTAGDKVMTTRGLSPVIWIGHRHLDCRHHPRPWDVLPVRVAQGAFAPGLPRRALTLSPDHAVFVDGVLIPVRYLINGATIVQEAATSVRYFHVELAHHAVLLAEGLACESFLDTGNRAAFANGGTAIEMIPDFARSVWATGGCAPLITEGPALLAARQRLFVRALATGHELEDDPALHLLADGNVVWPHLVAPGRYRFAVGPSRTLRLVSHAAILAETRPDIRDHRRLGVMVTRIARRRGKAWRNLPLKTIEGSGWHEVEGRGRWRWTDGDAALPVAATSAMELDISIADWAKPWRQPSVGGLSRLG